MPDGLKEEALDVYVSNNYLFIYKSHEDYSKVRSDSSTTNNSLYSYCAMPAEKYYETNSNLCEENK